MKKLRKELNRLIEKYGLTHPIVIEYSNKLNNAILPIQIKRLEEYKEISPVFEEDIYEAISMKTCVEKRMTIGAPGPDVMEKVIAENKKYLEEN